MKKLADFPEYVTAAAKLAEVKARLASAQAECNSLLRNIEGARSKTESLSDQAQRMLNGDDATVADIGSMRDRYGRACRQVALHTEVVRLATWRVEQARAEASREICEAARPEFSRLVEAELQAGMALLAAQNARREYWQGLHYSGVLMATMPALAPVLRATFSTRRGFSGCAWPMPSRRVTSRPTPSSALCAAPTRPTRYSALASGCWRPAWRHRRSGDRGRRPHRQACAGPVDSHAGCSASLGRRRLAIVKLEI